MSPSSRSQPRLPRRGLRLRRLLGRRDGQSLVEFVLVGPLLLMLLLGVIELGRALEVGHALSGIGREAANIAARGTELDTVVEVVMANGTDISLPEQGGTVVSRVQVELGAPIVKEQASSPGYAARTRVGRVDSTAVTFQGLPLLEGRSYWVVELFYQYRSLTPFRKLFGFVPEEFYDRTVF